MQLQDVAVLKLRRLTSRVMHRRVEAMAALGQLLCWLCPPEPSEAGTCAKLEEPALQLALHCMALVAHCLQVCSSCGN